jgi:hypothetical protein
MKKRLISVLLTLLIIGGAVNLPAGTMMPSALANLPVRTASEMQAVITQINGAQPGSTIVVPNGIYNNFQFTAGTAGTQASPVVIRAETPGSVVLTGLSRITISGRFITIDGFYFRGAAGVDHNLSQAVAFSSTSRNCTLRRTAIVDWNPTDRARDTRWVRVTGYNHLIDQCYLRGKNTPGMKLEFVRAGSSDNAPAGNENHTVTRTYFGQFANGGGNGYETVRVGLSQTSLTGRANIRMEYNYFYQTNGENEIISNKSNNNTYRYNTFFDSVGELTLRHGNDCLVEGNVFVDTNGSRMIGERHRMIGNYFGNTRSNGLQINNGMVTPELNEFWAALDSVIENNTFYSNVTSPARQVIIGQGFNAVTRPTSATGVFNRNLMSTTASSGNFFAVSDSSIVNQGKMTFSGNHAFGRGLGITNATAMAGFNTTTNPQMVRNVMNGPFDIFTPSNTSINAGFRIADLKAPMTPIEILPDWMIDNIYADVAGFTFPANMKPLRTATLPASTARGIAGNNAADAPRAGDLAFGATASGSTTLPRAVSGSNTNSSRPAAGAFSDDYDAFWQLLSGAAADTKWLAADFSATTARTVTFDRVVVQGRQDARPTNYNIEVQYANTTTWVPVFTEGGSGVSVANGLATAGNRGTEITFAAPITAAQVRVRVLQSTTDNNNVQLTRLAIYRRGDISGDGNINASDITLLRSYIAAQNKEAFLAANPAFSTANADVNSDGFINSADITLLRRWLAAADKSTVPFGPRP